MSQFEQAVVFGKYLLLERIGVGGMAEIFTATRRDADERLVIKRILPGHSEDEQFIRMFIEEAKLCEGLRHPNLVEVYDEGEVDGQYFIAMELVDGPDLLQTLSACGKQQIGFPSDLALFIVMEVLRGLEYAHSKTDAEGKPLGIIHRDLSPSNILLSRRGRVKITDFGIAKAASREATAAGVLKGKFGYMAPEQVMGEPLDRRTDIFAVGILLYELLSGHRLFAGKNDLGVLDRIRRADVSPSLSHFRPDLDAELEEIVNKALARDPDARFLTAVALLRALEGYVHSVNAVVSSEAVAELLRQLFPVREAPDRAVGFVDPEDPSRGLSHTEGEILPGSSVMVTAEDAGPTSAGAGPDQEALDLWRRRRGEPQEGLQVSLSEALSSASVPSMSAWSNPDPTPAEAAGPEDNAVPQEATPEPSPGKAEEAAGDAEFDATVQLAQPANVSDASAEEEPATAHTAALRTPSSSLSPEPDPEAAALLSAKASTPNPNSAEVEAETLHFSLSEIPGAPDGAPQEELEAHEPGLGSTRILGSELSSNLIDEATEAFDNRTGPRTDSDPTGSASEGPLESGLSTRILGSELSSNLIDEATEAFNRTDSDTGSTSEGLLEPVRRQSSTLERSMSDRTALGDLAEVAALEAAPGAQGFQQPGSLSEEGADDLFGALSALDELEYPFENPAGLSGRTEAYDGLAEELEGSQATRLGLLGDLDEPTPEPSRGPGAKSATVAAPLLEEIDGDTAALNIEHTLDEGSQPPLDGAALTAEAHDSPSPPAPRRGADALRAVVERGRAAKERIRTPLPPDAPRIKAPPPAPMPRAVFEADTAEISPAAPASNGPAPLGRPAPTVDPSPRTLYLLSALLILSLVVVGFVLASALSADTTDQQGVVEVLDVPLGQLLLECDSPFDLRVPGVGDFSGGRKLEEAVPPGSYEVSILKGGEVLKTLSVDVKDQQTVKLPCPG